LRQLQDLAKPGLRLVLADEAVPAGRYSLLFLDKAAQDEAFGANYKEQVLQNVVSYEENVRAVLAKVRLGEAEAGIVYQSDISGIPDTGDVSYLEIPDELNWFADYPVAAIQDSAHPEIAQAFVDYILSETGQSILGKFGFIPAVEP
jgi:molybdate transport system substrate-binding protein